MTMKTAHFFKIKSRMGLLNSRHPLGWRKDAGVENGFDVVLTDDFVKKFPFYRASRYVFLKPEGIRPGLFNRKLSEEINECQEFINKRFKPGQTQIVIGGDHSVTLPSVLAVRDRIGGFEDLGYVQFDSHGDINSAASSPTGNFHGMYVRPLMDDFDISEINKLVPLKLPPENMMYFGDLDLDSGEAEVFRKNKIVNINSKALGDKSRVIKNFKKFASSFKYLHVTFDIDVLNKTQAPATGIPAEKGLMLEDIKELLNIISRHPNLSFDLTEINSKKPGLEKTVKSAHKVLLASLAGCF